MRNSFFSGLNQFATKSVLQEASSDSKFGLDGLNVDSDTQKNLDANAGGDASDTEPADDSKFGLNDAGNATTPDTTDADKTGDETGDADSKFGLGDTGTAQDDSQPSDGNPPDDANNDDNSNTEGDQNQDNTANDSSMPPLKILNLSEQNKQLNNLRLFKQYRKLINDATNTLTVLTRQSFDANQQVAADKLVDNLTDFIDDITLSVQVKYSDTYETNMSTYLTYLHRYSVTVNMIRSIYDINKEDEDKK